MQRLLGLSTAVFTYGQSAISNRASGSSGSMSTHSKSVSMTSGGKEIESRMKDIERMWNP
jgi:hypothetical protein